MVCPKCGSNNVDTHVTQENNVQTKTKGFGWIKACLGTFLTSLFMMPCLGFFCGFCGMGKGKTNVTTTTKVIHVCKDCGHTF